MCITSKNNDKSTKLWKQWKQFMYHRHSDTNGIIRGNLGFSILPKDTWSPVKFDLEKEKKKGLLALWSAVSLFYSASGPSWHKGNTHLQCFSCREDLFLSILQRILARDKMHSFLCLHAPDPGKRLKSSTPQPKQHLTIMGCQWYQVHVKMFITISDLQWKGHVNMWTLWYTSW